MTIIVFFLFPYVWVDGYESIFGHWIAFLALFNALAMVGIICPWCSALNASKIVYPFYPLDMVGYIAG